MPVGMDRRGVKRGSDMVYLREPWHQASLVGTGYAQPFQLLVSNSLGLQQVGRLDQGRLFLPPATRWVAVQ